jgi:hypothetical protein
MATSTSISAVWALASCEHLSLISSSPPTGRAFCLMLAVPNRDGEPSVISVHWAQRLK